MILIKREIKREYTYGEEGVVFVLIPKSAGETIEFELTANAAEELSINLNLAVIDARKKTEPFESSYE